jgi:hypothetical protein
MIPTRTPGELAEALAAPFPEHELRWKPRSVQGSKALAVAYLTVTAIETRLDETLGIDGWEDSYQVLPSGAVVCTLRCRFGDTWISKQDIGTPSQNDAAKGGFSDSLKRCARKFGVGRYLCRLGPQWVAYDARAKRITEVPRLPVWAMPQPSARPAHAADTNSTPAKPHALPKTGRELEERLAVFEAKLVKEGLCDGGDLCRHVLRALMAAGHGSEVEKWGKAAIEQAVQEVKDFEQRAREKQARKESTRKRIAEKAV